jgi:hypothetical protein
MEVLGWLFEIIHLGDVAQAAMDNFAATVQICHFPPVAEGDIGRSHIDKGQSRSQWVLRLLLLSPNSVLIPADNSHLRPPGPQPDNHEVVGRVFWLKV